MSEKDEDNDNISYHYHMKGFAKASGYLFSGFLVWCTFNYPMSDTMQDWFYIWAVATWILI